MRDGTETPFGQLPAVARPHLFALPG